ncbi:hypothetical protein DFH07DRAFT_806813 [Mycena maculata]|uniref:F-box domain-containing protein n=1 Tax=Mycena maculata TaxID=230809 RepID=A0AAD7JTA3_9AGAR|nr:hypothetical protein DFH07DRAFT_806813 [Mycena maculata]
MASVAVTTLLEELSLTIARQREVLRQLETQKSTVQSNLNAILDPMSRLPLEISSDIMLSCLPTILHPDPHVAPMIFLGICHSWSNIAVSTPALWSDIRINSDSTISQDHLNLIHCWVARARTRPLSLSLHGISTPGLCALAAGYGHQLQKLDLYFPSGEELRNVTGSSFPTLDTLTIGQGYREDSDDDDDTFYSPHAIECIEMLSTAPLLVEFVLDGIYFNQQVQEGPRSLLTHSNLRRLRLGGYPSWGIRASGAYILPYLTLPSLERLWISDCNISFDDLFVFLSRSSAPLQSLAISFPYYFDTTIPPTTIERFLPLIPSVNDLDMSFNGGVSRDFVLSLAVAAVGSRAVPNLTNLTIRGSHVECSHYDLLLGALSTGHASRSLLQSFKLVWYGDFARDRDSEPGPDIIAGMQKLVADGMKIYIGPHTRNLI